MVYRVLGIALYMSTVSSSGAVQVFGDAVLDVCF